MLDDPRAPAVGRARALRWLRRLTLALLLAPLVWLFVINMVLWTGLLGSLVSGEQARATVRLDYERAWCVWPTVVHVEGLHLEVDGARWQLDLAVPRGEIDLHLWALLDRRLDVDQIRGEGVSLGFAVKRPHGAAASEYAGYLHLEHLDLPPVLDAEERPVPDEESAWELRLRSIDADLEHLQINAIEAELEGHVHAALEVTVAHRFALPIASAKIDAATIHRGEAVLAEDVRAQATVALGAYNPEEIRGRAALRGLSAAIDLEATTPGLAILDALGVDRPRSLHGGAGSLTANLGIREGALTPGSKAHFSTRAIELRHKGDDGAVTLSAAARIAASVPEGGTRGPQISAVLRAIKARDRGADGPWLEAKRLDAGLSFASSDLVDGPGAMTSIHAELPDFNADLGATALLRGAGLRSGKLSGRASAERGEGAEIEVDFAFDVDELGLRRGDLSLRGDGYVRSRGTVRRGEGTIELGPIRAALRGVRIESARGRTTGAWVELERTSLTYASEHQRLRLGVHGRLADLRGLLAHALPGEDLFERTPNLGIGRDPVDFSLTLTKTPRSLLVDVDSLKGGPVDLVAAFHSAGETLRGAIYFQRARVGVLTAGGGSRTVKLAVDPEWFTDRAAWVRDIPAKK